MRLLLAFFLTHVVGESLVTIFPIDQFADQLDMRRRPRRLPTCEEQQKLLAEATDDNPAPLADEVTASLDSVWEFHKPWPSHDTRKAMQERAWERRLIQADGGPPAWLGNWGDRGKFVLAWVGYRLEWQERLLGFDQSWRMFSPSVGKGDWIVRARLVYEDGSEVVVHSLADPEDLTRFRTPRFGSEKILQYSLKLEKHDTRRVGYCNLLSHRHATNEAGSPLVKILLVKIGYDYPSPWEDVRAELKAQIGPPDWEKTPPFFEYDVKKREGKELETPE
jgi:hypothetical protein